jgi:hypothetical protein
MALGTTLRSHRKTLCFHASTALLAVMMLAGCGGSDPTTGPPPTDLEGVCTITVDGTQGGENIDFTGEFDLSQNGMAVSGTWIWAEGTADEASGTVAGGVSGINFDFTLTQTDPCDGSFSGSASFTVSDQVAGSFSGSSDCNGDLEANFFLLDCVTAE